MRVQSDFLSPYPTNNRPAQSLSPKTHTISRVTTIVDILNKTKNVVCLNKTKNVVWQHAAPLKAEKTPTEGQRDPASQ